MTSLAANTIQFSSTKTSLTISVVLTVLFSIDGRCISNSKKPFHVDGKFISVRVPSKQLRDRKVGNDLLEKKRLAHNLVGIYSEALAVEDARKRCPKLTAFFQKIFNKIVDLNSLGPLVHENLEIEPLIVCSENPKSFLNNVPMLTEFNEIIMPRTLALFSHSEDEVATAVSHEIIHAILQHSEIKETFLDKLALELSKDIDLDGTVVTKEKKDRLAYTSSIKYYQFLLEQEATADKLGALLAWNAGYSPYYLSRILRSYSTYNNSVIGRFIYSISERFHICSPTHGCTEDRIARLESFLKTTAADPSVPAIVSKDYLEAKSEVSK